MIRIFAVLVGAICVAAVLGGCADPTEGKPEAVVTEAVAEPVPIEASGDGETVAVYRLTEYTGIGFEGSKVTGPHVGGFGSFEGSVSVPDGNLALARIVIDIDATSLFSDDPGLTEKLKSADFFDVEKFPTARFVSTAIDRPAEVYFVTGNLTMHGVTKSVSFPAEIAIDGTSLTASAEFSINRFDWGIEYAGMADDLIRNGVLILLDVEATLESE